jgi:hypothetical protein
MKITHDSPDSSKDLEVALTTLRPNPLARPAPATASPGTSYWMPYANERQNSRVGATAGAPTVVRWRSPLMPGHKPRFVLTDGNSIVVQAAAWQSFGTGGLLLASGRIGPAQMCVDGAKGLVYSIDANGFLAAYSTVDGKRSFMVMPAAGDNAGFTFVSGRGRDLMVAAFSPPEGNFESRGKRASSTEPPGPMSLVELTRLPESTAHAGGSLLTGAMTTGFHVPGARIAAARSDDLVVAAVPRAVFFLDGGLNVKSAYSIDGTPLAASLDEASRAYVIVESAGRRELWQLSSAGEIGFLLPLPASSDMFPIPPVIGYDHRVFAVSGREVQAIDANGKPLWSHQFEDIVAGIVVLPSGALMVGAGSTLMAVTPQGVATPLIGFPGERIMTAAAVTSAGSVLIATDKALYSLGSR